MGGISKTIVIMTNINDNSDVNGEAEVFVNGEQPMWGRYHADIAVIVNSTKADGNGGISKPVVITD